MLKCRHLLVLPLNSTSLLFSLDSIPRPFHPFFVLFLCSSAHAAFSTCPTFGIFSPVQLLTTVAIDSPSSSLFRRQPVLSSFSSHFSSLHCWRKRPFVVDQTLPFVISLVVFSINFFFGKTVFYFPSLILAVYSYIFRPRQHHSSLPCAHAFFVFFLDCQLALSSQSSSSHARVNTLHTHTHTHTHIRSICTNSALNHFSSSYPFDTHSALCPSSIVRIQQQVAPSFVVVFHELTFDLNIQSTFLPVFVEKYSRPPQTLSSCSRDQVAIAVRNTYILDVWWPILFDFNLLFSSQPTIQPPPSCSLKNETPPLQGTLPGTLTIVSIDFLPVLSFAFKSSARAARLPLTSVHSSICYCCGKCSSLNSYPACGWVCVSRCHQQSPANFGRRFHLITRHHTVRSTHHRHCHHHRHHLRHRIPESDEPAGSVDRRLFDYRNWHRLCVRSSACARLPIRLSLPARPQPLSMVCFCDSLSEEFICLWSGAHF